MLKAALWYASHGLAVFPVHSVADGRCSCGNADCANAGKHPRTARGLTDATMVSDKIKAFWTAAPDANVGIATGLSDLVVVDVDPRHDGDESLAVLRAAIGAECFETVTALTGGGGQHLYYRAPESLDIRNSAGLLGPGLDVRANGGYVLAPPSSHASGNPYRWEADYGIHEREIMALPDALVERLQQRKATTMTAEQIETIPDGKRDITLASIAGSLRRRGLGAEEILATLVVVNERRCKPPMALSDLERIAKSIARYAPETPIAAMDVNKPAVLVTDFMPQPVGAATMQSWSLPQDRRRFMSGIPQLDGVLTGFHPGEISLIGAWTGVGKSGFSEQTALEVSKDYHVLFFPLELGTVRTERRMLAKIMRCSEDWIQQLQTSEFDGQRRELYAAIETMQTRKMSMYAPKPPAVLTYQQLRQIIVDSAPEFVVVDHLQHIDDWTPTNGKRPDLSAAQIFRDLRALAEELSLHVLCVHQLKATTLKKNQRPQLYDFADSAALPRVADQVLTLHRPFRGYPSKDRIMEIMVQKNRHGAEPWVHTHFIPESIAMMPMTSDESRDAACCRGNNA